MRTFCLDCGLPIGLLMHSAMLEKAPTLPCCTCCKFTLFLDDVCVRLGEGTAQIKSEKTKKIWVRLAWEREKVFSFEQLRSPVGCHLGGRSKDIWTAVGKDGWSNHKQDCSKQGEDVRIPQHPDVSVAASGVVGRTGHVKWWVDYFGRIWRLNMDLQEARKW